MKGRLKEFNFNGSFEYNGVKFEIPYVSVFDNKIRIECIEYFDYDKAISFYNEYTMKENMVSNEEVFKALKANLLTANFMPFEIVINDKISSSCFTNDGERRGIERKSEIFIKGLYEESIIIKEFLEKYRKTDDDTAFRYFCFELYCDSNVTKKLKNIESIEFKRIKKTLFGTAVNLRLSECVSNKVFDVNSADGKRFNLKILEVVNKKISIKRKDYYFVVIFYILSSELSENENIEFNQNLELEQPYIGILGEKNRRYGVILKRNENDNTYFWVRHVKNVYTDIKVLKG